MQTFVYADGHMYITAENMLLGPPRMSQARVKSDSCIVYKHISSYYNSCYTYFTRNVEDTQSFGFKNGSAWCAGTSGGVSIGGKLGSYPCGKFYHVFTQNEDAELAALSELQHGGWIDRSTRAVIIEFTIYNANLDMLCFTQ